METALTALRPVSAASACEEAAPVARPKLSSSKHLAWSGEVRDEVPGSRRSKKAGSS